MLFSSLDSFARVVLNSIRCFSVLSTRLSLVTIAVFHYCSQSQIKTFSNTTSVLSPEHARKKRCKWHVMMSTDNECAASFFKFRQKTFSGLTIISINTNSRRSRTDVWVSFWNLFQFLVTHWNLASPFCYFFFLSHSRSFVVGVIGSRYSHL